MTRLAFVLSAVLAAEVSGGQMVGALTQMGEAVEKGQNRDADSGKFFRKVGRFVRKAWYGGDQNELERNARWRDTRDRGNGNYKKFDALTGGYANKRFARGSSMSMADRLAGGVEGWYDAPTPYPTPDPEMNFGGWYDVGEEPEMNMDHTPMMKRMAEEQDMTDTKTFKAIENAAAIIQTQVQMRATAVQDMFLKENARLNEEGDGALSVNEKELENRMDRNKIIVRIRKRTKQKVDKQWQSLMKSTKARFKAHMGPMLKFVKQQITNLKKLLHTKISQAMQTDDDYMQRAANYQAVIMSTLNTLTNMVTMITLLEDADSEEWTGMRMELIALEKLRVQAIGKMIEFEGGVTDKARSVVTETEILKETRKELGDTMQRMVQTKSRMGSLTLEGDALAGGRQISRQLAEDWRDADERFFALSTRVLTATQALEKKKGQLLGTIELIADTLSQAEDGTVAEDFESSNELYDQRKSEFAEGTQTFKKTTRDLMRSGLEVARNELKQLRATLREFRLSGNAVAMKRTTAARTEGTKLLVTTQQTTNEALAALNENLAKFQAGREAVILRSQADEQNALSAEASIKGANEEILARADAPVQRAISDDQDAIRAAVKDADAQAALEIEDATAKVRDEGDTAATVDRDLQDNFADRKSVV